jgi:glycosyltransferase involved in cell wall biosynthesis
MKVLHVSHTSVVSGGEHSLLTLLQALPENVECGVACPPGELADAVLALGIDVYPLPALSASLRLHPVHTARAAIELAGATAATCRIARRTGATVLHANSVRAGLITGAASIFGAPPAAVHVRDVLPPGRVTLAIRRGIVAGSGVAVATSHYVANRFAAGLPRAPNIVVVDNPVDLRRFRRSSAATDAARAELGIPPRAPLLGIVGQITHWKGHDTAIAALARVRERHPEARLLIVGSIKFATPSTRFDNRSFLEGLRRQIAERRLDRHVSFLGERADVSRILSALDVLLVPSLEEPFGRTVAEAMAMATPVVATTVGGPRELLEDGVTGLLAPPGDPAAWAASVERMLDRPDETRAMAERAQTVATRRFNPERHAGQMIAVLRSVSLG